MWDEYDNKRIPRPDGAAPYGTRSQRLKEMKAEGILPPKSR